MAWKQRNESCKTVSDAVCALSGLSESELLHPVYTPPQEIQNLSLAAEAIREAVQRKENISVMGDYDADGVTASSILYFALEKHWHRPLRSSTETDERRIRAQPVHYPRIQARAPDYR